jgi:hypothetical protein
MPLPPVALKRKNHRLLLCENTKKQDLLAKLLLENEGRRIAVVFSDDAQKVSVPENVVVLTDDTLGGETFELLISYDLPLDPAQYFARLALCADTALTLLGESDRKNLLAIETVLGRAISQERPEGFAPQAPAQPKQLPKRFNKAVSPAPKAREPQKPPFKKEARPAAKRTPKESGVSRFIGMDENGKPMFSGKTGERNHRKDGKPHDEESMTAKKEWDDKRRENGGKKPYEAKKKPPFKDDNDRRKPQERSGEQRSGESGGKKAYDDKKPAFRGDKKPYDAKAPSKGKKPYGGKRPAGTGAAKADDTGKPKRPPRRIKADDYKPTEPTEPKS